MSLPSRHPSVLLYAHQPQGEFCEKLKKKKKLKETLRKGLKQQEKCAKKKDEDVIKEKEQQLQLNKAKLDMRCREINKKIETRGFTNTRKATTTITIIVQCSPQVFYTRLKPEEN